MARVPGLVPRKFKAAKDDPDEDDNFDIREDQFARDLKPGTPEEEAARAAATEERIRLRDEREKAGKKSPGIKRPTPIKSQPGPGAPTGGTGKDQDGGDERTRFEDDRRGRNEGGKDRPPVYRPSPSAGRGVGMSLTKTKGLPVIDKRTVKQKLADASRRRA